MSGGYRLASGGRIDRSRPLHFRMDGVMHSGFAGDTLASALLANGVRVVGRSFKLHRPRGVMAAGVEETNALVDVGKGANAEANLKATEIELVDGLEARSVNAWPRADRDALGVLGLLKPFLPAGFYYKTFIRPSWDTYEGMIRRAAGLGHAPVGVDPDTYEKQFAHADVVVVGGGIAGLVAAWSASAGDAQVILIDDQPELGGTLLGQPVPINGDAPDIWLSRVEAELRARPNVRLLTRTTATGVYDHHFVLACARRLGAGPRQRLWKIRAKKVLLASGAFERPLVFPDNDRPGVMLAGAARTYVERYGVAAGRSAIVVTNNDSAYHAAFSLRAAGVKVSAIADLRASPPRHALDAARHHDIEVMPATAPAGVAGRHGVKSIKLASVDGAGRLGAASQPIDCDLVCMSGGWSPALHLYAQAGGAMHFDAERGAIVPDAAFEPVVCVGAARGTFTLAASIAEAYAAGAHAAHATGHPSNDGFITPKVDEWPQVAAAPIVELRSARSRGAHSWVDLQNDVTAADVRLAARENYRSVEHLKRYTTLGMAVDQGKTSNVNAIAIMAAATERTMDAVGTTRFRPPYTPTTLGAFAGREVGQHYRPLRRLPAHEAHAELGAVIEDYGGWLRPAFYPKADESEATAVTREVLAVRGGVGLFDGSPLGKIEVCGPDAAEFLNRIYVNNMLTLGVGKARYGLMLDENGIVKDDGVLSRISADKFLVGTTSAGANSIGYWLEEWLNCEWPHLNATIAPVTSQWAVMTVTGPRARDLLRAFDTSIDLSAGACPHMNVREGTFAGVPARIHRVSFTGELSFEVAVPARYGQALWREMLKRGQAFGVTPYGIEALMVMRVEKGYLHIGADTDGTTMPQDVGFAEIMAKKKADYAGKRSTMLPVGRDPRREFVGLEVADGEAPLPIGAHIVDPSEAADTRRTHGWVTSTCFSPTLERPVALALVENGRARMGEIVTLTSTHGRRSATVVGPCAYDPNGERLNG
ncbi:MAG: sarcosine oxidase subunit alpha family protein [Alphaproteobacteria bacterium]|nr:sarcosine oxidase subunit alpha family protein [Alphaproteobacteria bacterium]